MRETRSIRLALPVRPRVGPADAPVGTTIRSALGAALSAASSGAAVPNTALVAALLEACRYACGCPRSRLRQRAALRGLDARRLDDLGLTRREARIGRREGAGAP